jgi:glycosyltransferase involved in cell wall biosynthesis
MEPAVARPGPPVPIGLVIGQLCHGGAERQLYELVRGLDAHRYRCIVYCLSDVVAPYGPLIERAGAVLRVLPRARHLDLGRVRSLARLLRADRVHLVHAFLFQANAYAWLACRRAGIPRLVTSARNCQGIGHLRDLVNRLAFRGSDAILCNGEAVRAFVRLHYGAPVGRCVVIPNGVDTDRFAPASAPVAGQRVVTVARLVPQKDVELFIEAAVLLHREAPSTRFAIVGDGPSRPDLEALAAARGLGDALAFLGARTDVPEILRSAQVFWLASAVEGLPNVVLEAAASGLPVVARDVGACREIVRHGLTGYLVGTRDPEPFVRHTLPLLADPARAREMGRAGRAVVEDHFSLTQMVRATARLYDELLGTRVPAVAAAATARG